MLYRGIFIFLTYFMAIYASGQNDLYPLFQPFAPQVDTITALKGNYQYLKLDELILQEIVLDNKEIISFSIQLSNAESLSLTGSKSDFISENYKLSSSQPIDPSSAHKPHFYKGIYNENSIIRAWAASFSDDAVNILILMHGESYRLAHLERDIYILYPDNEISAIQEFNCETPETEPDDLEVTIKRSTLNDCVDIYVECDFQSYLDLGSNAYECETWALSLFNEVSLIYELEEININVSEVHVWNSSDPYINYNNTNDILNQFSLNIGNNHSGRLAHLLSTRNLGGRAFIDVLCNLTLGHGLSCGLSESVTPYPAYSWGYWSLLMSLGIILDHAIHMHAYGMVITLKLMIAETLRAI